MWCEVRICRIQGERIARDRWGDPVRGHLFVGYVHRGARAMRVAELYERSPQWERPLLKTLFEPMIETWGRGFILKGYEIHSAARGGALFEHRQIWYCVASTQSREGP